jgi:hypothetical protein
MLTAVWVAVVVGVACWVVVAWVAVHLMTRTARLVSETTTTVTGLRERGDELTRRAGAVIDRAGEQVTSTEAITASMAEVTGAMPELGEHVTALNSAARAVASGAGMPLARIAAFAYGVSRAVGMRRPGRAARGGGAGAVRQPAQPGRAELTGARQPSAAAARKLTPAGRRRPALTSRQDGTRR